MAKTIDQSLLHTIYVRNLKKQQFIGVSGLMQKKIANVFYEPILEIEFIGSRIKEITDAKW